MTLVEQSLLAAHQRACKICQAPSCGANYGVDTCRACATFFRRAIYGRRQFATCRAAHDCPAGRSCRACRLSRCLSLGMLQEIRASRLAAQTPGKRLALTHAKLESADDESSLLAPMAAAYRDLCVERLRLECAYFEAEERLQGRRFPEERALERRGPLPFVVRLCTERAFDELHREAVPATVRFFVRAFQRLRDVGAAEIISLHSRILIPMMAIEGAYRALSAFTRLPDDYVFGTYTTIVWYSDMSFFFSDCVLPFRNKHFAQNVAKISYPLRRLCASHFQRMQLTEIEFLAVYTLTLWPSLEPSYPDELMALSAYYRNRVCQDLSQYYRALYDRMNAAARLGEILALSAAIEQEVFRNNNFLALCTTFACYDTTATVARVRESVHSHGLLVCKAEEEEEQVD